MDRPDTGRRALYGEAATVLPGSGGSQLFGAILPLHDAARLVSGLFVGVAMLFLGLTARELHGRGQATATLLLFVGCLGTFLRLHQLVTDVALLAGVAAGLYGLALARRTLWGAAAALGLGATVAFLAKGLLGPGLLAVTALLLPLHGAWRNRRYAGVLASAALVAAIPAVVWMSALYARSPDLFRDWLVTNNLGRFLGLTRIGPHTPPGYYAYTLLWYAFPALPLSAFAFWQAWRRNAKDVLLEMHLPLVFAAVVATVLGLASDSRELYLLPLMLPLALLGARGLAWLPEVATTVMSQGARRGLATLAIVLWLAWLALVTGAPAFLQSRLLDYQPGYVPEVAWTRVAIALAFSLAAAAALWRPGRSAAHALAQWAVGVTLFWALLATLWEPYVDAGKSYRTMIQSLAAELPQDGCVASLHLGEPQRGLMTYFAQVTTKRLEAIPDAACSALLVQGWRATGAPAPERRWVAVWEGARPGDEKELYRLYRRDFVAVGPIVSFPRKPAPSLARQ